MATPSSPDPRAPERGDVIEFSFLWKHERAAGLLEGVKDRRLGLERQSRIVTSELNVTDWPGHDL